MSYLVMDVSKYNTVTSWSSVASQIDGVIIRAGYRGYGSSGTLTTDSSFSSHISGAAAAGIPLSVYFFTQATSTTEAQEEAAYTLNLISGYTMSMPIFVDSEYSNTSHNGRADSLSAANRTTYLIAFLDYIQNAGYTAGVYASDSWYNSMVTLSKLTSYKLWVAKYSTTSPQYVDDYIGWQYTSSGSISGVSSSVDLSYWYEEIGSSSGSTEKDPNKYYYDTYTGDSVSLVTALAAVGCNDTTYAYRKVIAAANGVSGYSGTSTQNTSMLNLLKQGLLIDPSGGDTTAPTISTTSNTCGSATVSITDDVYLSTVTINSTTQTLASTYTLATAGTSYAIIATDAAGNSASKTITVADHSYSKATTAATCTTQGYTVYTCTVCGSSYTGDYVSATGHTYTATSTVAATCTTQGYTVYTCSSCGTTYTGDTTEATGHTYVATSKVEPTCQNEGYTVYTCSVCGDSYEDDYVDAIDHTYVLTTTVTPTCEEQGYDLYTCSVCGETYKDNYVNASGHNYSIFAGTVDPTCEEVGYDVYECSVCGARQYTNQKDALGHDFVLTETVAATCTANGYDLYTCTRCGETYETNEIDMLGHAYADPVFNWSTDYSECTATFTCTNCDETIDVECTVYVSGAEGVCDEGGYMLYSAVATLNGTRYTSNKEIYTEATGHSYAKTVIAATCTSQGYTQYTCTVCGDSYKDSYVDALGHDYKVSSTSTANCTTSGYIEYICSRCGASYTGDYVEALGHNYSTETHSPTCTEMGYTIYTCATCGETYTGDYVAALGHNFVYVGTTTETTVVTDYDFYDADDDNEEDSDYEDYDFGEDETEVASYFTDYDFNDEDEGSGDSTKLYYCTRCGIYMTGYDIADGENLYYGSSVDIIDCPLYPIPESWISEYTKSGTFYIWNPTVTNGRVMITNNLDYVNTTQLVCGWIDVSEIGKTIVVESGAKYGIGDEIVAENLAMYETASSSKVIAIKNGYLYVTKATIMNGRIAFTDDESLVGDTDAIVGWAKTKDL